MRVRIIYLIFLSFFCVSILNTNASESEITTIYDKDSFVLATGSNLSVKFPDSTSSSAQYKENNIIIKHAGGFQGDVSDYTDIIPGNEFAVSGPENIDIAFPDKIKAFGIFIHDKNSNDGNCIANDSQFNITLKNDNSIIGIIENIDPPVDQLFFVGLVSNEFFNKVEIREKGSPVTTDSSTYCENDFFGPIYSTISVNELQDIDQDGVIDLIDKCLDTREGACTDKNGCECDYQYTEEDMLKMVNKLLDWDKNKDGKIGLQESVQILKDATGVKASNVD